MDDRRKLACDIKEQLVLKAIEAISIKEIEEKWSNDECYLSIRTNSLFGVDDIALNKAKSELSNEEFSIDWYIPITKCRDGVTTVNLDTVTMHITSNVAKYHEKYGLVY